MKNLNKINNNIYITSDEEIKEGDYWIYICPINGLDYGDNNNTIVKNNLPPTWFEKLHDKKNYKKVILTTDKDLIKDGVQDIDDEFLEWFVKNPSCEEVEVDLLKKGIYDEYKYKIIILKEEPKKECECTDECLGYLTKECKRIEEPKIETLEEVAERTYSDKLYPMYGGLRRDAFINGAKWQQEKSYSEEDLEVAFFEGQFGKYSFNDWFEQFKKK